MTPRRLAPNDPALPGVQRLVAEAFPPGSGAPSAGLGLADLAARMAAGPALVTERDGVPIACVFSRPSDFRPGALYVGTLVVAPATRGTGQARALIATMSEEARRAGFTGLVVAVDTADLVAFYEHLGSHGFATAPPASCCTARFRRDQGRVSGRLRVQSPAPWI